MKIVGAVVLGLILLIMLGWVLTANDVAMFKFFAPKYEQVRRETFEQSKAYNQGMIQELQNMQFEYAKATPEQRQALAAIILHRAADYDTDKLPTDLRQFVTQLRRERSDTR